MNHVMIDLETLGAHNCPVILQVGAVGFDPMNSDMAAPYKMNCHIAKQVDEWGATMDAKTVAWWLQQSKEAQTSVTADPEDLYDVLEALSQYVGKADRVWAKGTNFDLHILHEWYARTMDVPNWLHWSKWRDCRTFYDMLGPKGGLPERTTLAHDAAEDAMYQARVVCIGYAAMRISHE